MIEGWGRRDWDRLARLFDGLPGTWRPDRGWKPYAGYKPDVREAPNGDSRRCSDCDGDGERKYSTGDYRKCEECGGSGEVPNIDAQKRYLHVADKYSPPAWARVYQDVAYAHAARVAEALKVPREFFPAPSAGALRVLEYPAGAGSAEHCDFDLFTVLCWRETPDDLELSIDSHDPVNISDRMAASRRLSPGLHTGELGELVGLGPATPHRVPARPYVQRSIVYFALPDHSALLPGTWIHDDGSRKPQTVGEWLNERMKRSRYT